MSELLFFYYYCNTHDKYQLIFVLFPLFASSRSRASDDTLPRSSWSQASQQDPQTRCRRRKLMVRFVVCSCGICCPHTVHLKILPPSILTGPTITVGDEYHRLNSGTMPKFIVLLKVSCYIIVLSFVPRQVIYTI